MPLKHLVEAETHRLCLPPLPALHPSLPGTEGKQRTPEIASLPAVRQEATIPTTESSHAIDTESQRCPAIHFRGPGRGGWQGSNQGPLPGDIPGKAGISSRTRGFSLPPKPPTLALPSQTQGLSWVYPISGSLLISGPIKYA